MPIFLNLFNIWKYIYIYILSWIPFNFLAVTFFNQLKVHALHSIHLLAFLQFLQEQIGGSIMRNVVIFSFNLLLLGVFIIYAIASTKSEESRTNGAQAFSYHTKALEFIWSHLGYQHVWPVSFYVISLHYIVSLHESLPSQSQLRMIT